MIKGRNKAIINETLRGLSIEIPAGGHRFVILFLIVWLIAWAGGEYFAFTSLRDMLRPNSFLPKNNALLPAIIFLCIWLIAWTFGGIFVFIQIIWMSIGKEVILIESGTMILTKKIGFISFSKAYDLRQIKSLRLKSDPFKWTLPYIKLANNKTNPTNKGTLKFIYANKVIRFASGISLNESKRLMESIKKHFPELD